MFLIKQVLPIVLLSMAIGFGVTWYKWRAANQAETVVADATPSSSTGASEPDAPPAAKIPVSRKPDVTPPPGPVQRKAPVEAVSRAPVTTAPVASPEPAPSPRPASAPKPVVRGDSRVPATANTGRAPAGRADGSVATVSRKPDVDPEFISRIEAEIDGLQSADQGPSAAAPPPGDEEPSVPDPGSTAGQTIPGWSVETFLDAVQQKRRLPESPSDAISSVISEAAKRSEQTAPTDPYLSVLKSEATDLTVTAVDAKEEADGLVRNKPYKPIDSVPGQAGEGWMYTVRAGESLSSIAAEVYGDRTLYMRIFQSNRDILSSPDSLQAGQRLRIPPP